MSDGESEPSVTDLNVLTNRLPSIEDALTRFPGEVETELPEAPAL